MEARYYSARELAAFGIPRLPRSERGMHDVARREQWPSREMPSKGGKRGMRTEYRPPASVQQQIEEIEARRSREGKIVDDALAQRAGEGASLRAEDFVMVPRYDVSGSAGSGALIHSEQIVDYLAFRSDWVRNVLGVVQKNLVLISVKGDSMEPTLSNGDLILIDTGTRHVEDSAIYVLKNHDGLLVKRLQHKVDGSVVVKSDNAKYESEVYDSDAAKTIVVVGRVVWAGRKL